MVSVCHIKSQNTAHKPNYNKYCNLYAHVVIFNNYVKNSEKKTGELQSGVVFEWSLATNERDKKSKLNGRSPKYTFSQKYSRQSGPIPANDNIFM